MVMYMGMRDGRKKIVGMFLFCVYGNIVAERRSGFG